MRFVFLLFVVAGADASDLRYFLVSEKGETTFVEPERVERRAWGEGHISTVPSPGWREFLPGLDGGQVRLWRSDTTGATLHLLRADPQRFRFALIGKAGPGRPIADWVRSEGAVAGVNAGYFFIKPGGTAKFPLGLTVKRGKTLAAYRKNYSGCFYATPGGSGFSVNAAPPSGATEVVQSFPMLISSGVIPEHLKTEVPDKLHIHVRRPRTAVGRDRQGFIWFMVSSGPLSFFELSFLAGVLGLSDCLALDGGRSAQMAVLTQPPLRISGGETVPLGIGVFRKD